MLKFHGIIANFPISSYFDWENKDQGVGVTVSEHHIKMGENLLGAQVLSVCSLDTILIHLVISSNKCVFRVRKYGLNPCLALISSAYVIPSSHKMKLIISTSHKREKERK